MVIVCGPCTAMREHLMGQASTAASSSPFANPIFARWHRRFAAQVVINGKPVLIEWSRAAQVALERRSQPLTLELELYFSCLVKKFVHFHESVPARETVVVNDRLRVFFRAVTSTACSMDLAQRLGRQPETELDSAAVRKLAPKRVWLDRRHGTWTAEYWL
ncbi:MAG: hypothetical protein U5L05_10960 [Rubrivivax sp.]|nr:hypothetical protein [Rubrivivax sp.]